MKPNIWIFKMGEKKIVSMEGAEMYTNFHFISFKYVPRILFLNNFDFLFDNISIRINLMKN